MRSRFSRIIALALAVLMLTAPVSAAVKVTDDVGKTITLTSVPKRVISLAPNVTEIIYALGAQSSLMGRTPVDDYPPEVKNVPVMGDYTQPNIELLLTKKPDLIIGTVSFSKDTYDIMQKYWNVFIADSKSVNDVSSLIDRMGMIFQKQTQAKKLEEQIRLMPVALKSLGGQHPRVLLLMWNDPPMSVGKGTFINDMLSQIGLISVTASYSQPWPTLGEESLLNLNPDYILYPEKSMGGETASFKGQPWSDLKAVKQGKVVSFNDDWVFRAGPRLTQGMAQLYLKVSLQKPEAKVLFVSNKAQVASLNGSLIDYSKFTLKNGRFYIDPAYAKQLGIAASSTANLRSISLQTAWVSTEKMGVFLLK
ncbi:ABC transporter substrate-binding protein [Coprothermobacter platensis]|uniref:ABC transporter substrate-binding protein n=1 Tax=Coprothermobacter platensis TaxID=108819 RepID=UPI0003619BDF|nr:helical backbone metal receptor [Coprothermobacter platensis]